MELNDPHCSPTPTEDDGSRPDESDKEKELSSSLKLKEFRRLKTRRRGISRVHRDRVTEKGRITVFPKNLPSQPCPFVSMDKLTSTQLLSYGIHEGFKILSPQPQSVPEHLRRKHQHPCTTMADDDLLQHPKSTLLQRHFKPTHKHNQDRKYPHCYFCLAKFKRRKDLNRNLNIHTGEKPHKCSKCNYSTGNVSAFRQHERNTRRNHNLTESDPGSKSAPCYFCNAKLKSSRTNRNLQRHLRLHTGETPFKCPKSRCTYSTVSSGHLSHHFRRCHKVSQSQKTVQDADVEKWRIRQTRIRNRWQRKNENEMREKASGPQDDVREYKCLICKDTFDVQIDFTRHLKSVHFFKKSCKCPECPKTLRNYGAMRSHVKYVHTLEKSFLCHICPFATKTQCSLERHFRSTHNQDTEYFHCYFCPSKLKDYHSLSSHLRQHTGEKPYKCPTCPYATGESSRLNGHIRSVHTSDQTLRTISCPKCPSMFLSVRELDGHAHYHKKINHKCIVCSHAAISRSILRKHVTEMHPKGEANFQCPHCPKKFKINSNLQQHIRSHTGEKPLKCNKCPYATGHRSNFSKHVRQCKGEGRSGGGGGGEAASFPCDECEQSFTSVGNVKRHKSKWHQNQKNLKMHQCPHCNLSFKELKNLECHLAKRHEKKISSGGQELVSTEQGFRSTTRTDQGEGGSGPLTAIIVNSTILGNDATAPPGHLSTMIVDAEKSQ